MVQKYSSEQFLPIEQALLQAVRSLFGKERGSVENKIIPMSIVLADVSSLS